MSKPLLSVLITGILIVSASSCSKTADDPADVVKLSSDEVAELLGIKEKDGIKVGNVESGKDGIKVKSISLKEGDTEVEISDVELRIGSTGKLVYSISYLKVGKLDLLDRKTSRHAQAFDVRVDKPGDRFLSKLEAAVSMARSSGSLKTADLSCSKLRIEKIDYQFRLKDNSVSRVRIDEFSITDATTETLGEVSVGRIEIKGVNDGKGKPEIASAKGLRITNVDRLWVDDLLTPDRGATTEPAAHPKPKSSEWGGRLLPLDRFEVAELQFTDKSSGVVKIADLSFEIKRGSDGQIAGIIAAVNLSVPTKMFGNGILDFIRTMGNPELDETLAGSFKLNMVVDPVRRSEKSEISIMASGLARISGTLTSRGLPKVLNSLKTAEKLPDDVLSISSIELEGRDDGLLVFLLSDRFKDREEVRKSFAEVPGKWLHGAERDRLTSEIDGFMKAPGAIKVSAESDELLGFKDFFAEAFKTLDSSEPPGEKSRIKLRLSFLRK